MHGWRTVGTPCMLSGRGQRDSSSRASQVMTRSSSRAGLATAVVLACALGRTAAAEKVAVPIDSDPPGATLYLDSRDSDPIGKTPFRGSLAEGTYTLIVELEGHEASVQTIRVKRKKGKRSLTF